MTAGAYDDRPLATGPKPRHPFPHPRRRREGGRRRLVLASQGRGHGARRRVGLGQERHRVLAAGADRPARPHRVGLGQAGRAGTCRHAARTPAQAQRQAHGHGLPGPGDDAEPGHHHRRADADGAGGAWRHGHGADARTQRAGADPRRHSRCGAQARRVPARVLRRHAPARRDRNRAAARSRAADRRRAHHRTRRLDPGADSGRDEKPRRRARYGADLDQPRPRHRLLARRPDRGDVCRPHRRGGPTAAVLRDPRHPYTQGLLDSLPARAEPGRDLVQIPGTTPSLLALPPGCAFAPRCPRADAACNVMPELVTEGTRRHRCWHPLGLEVAA